ncbi:MAG: oligosaccharide flippase family protein, partial [Halobacteriales archaeon]
MVPDASGDGRSADDDGRAPAAETTDEAVPAEGASGEEATGETVEGTSGEETTGESAENAPGATVPEDEREALLTIGQGAVVTSGGQTLQRALTTGAEYALAQGLGPVVYGVYAFAWRIAQLLFRLVNLGSIATLQRYLAAYDDRVRQGRVVGLSYLTTLVVGGVLAGGLFLGSDRLDAATVAHPDFPPTIRLFGALIVLVGLVRVHAGILRAMRSARGEVLFNRVLRPAVRLGAA